MNLDALGWTSFFEAQFEPYSRLGYIPARICNAQKQLYQTYSEAGEFFAEVSGKMLYTALSRSELRRATRRESSPAREGLACRPKCLDSPLDVVERR